MLAKLTGDALDGEPISVTIHLSEESKIVYCPWCEGWVNMCILIFHRRSTEIVLASMTVKQDVVVDVGFVQLFPCDSQLCQWSSDFDFSYAR